MFIKEGDTFENTTINMSFEDEQETPIRFDHNDLFVNSDEMYEWLEEHNVKWDSDWPFGTLQPYLEIPDKKDAMLFKLRFC